jgi:hypothetical protein
MAQPARIEQLVTGAGFEHLELSEVTMAWRFDGFDEFWSYTTELAGAISQVLAQLDPRELAEVRSDTQSGLERYKTGSGYDLPGACINVLAR